MKFLISLIVLSTLLNSCLTLVNVNSDIVFKAAISNTNTKFIATLFYVFPDTCPASMELKVCDTSVSLFQVISTQINLHFQKNFGILAAQYTNIRFAEINVNKYLPSQSVCNPRLDFWSNGMAYPIMVAFKNGSRVDGPWSYFRSAPGMELMVKANGG